MIAKALRTQAASKKMVAAHRMIIALILAGVVATGAPVIAEDRATAPANTRPIAGVKSQRIAALARGFNLSGLFETSSKPHLDMALMKRLRLLGFSHVRLPIGAALLEAPIAPEDARALLQDIDAVLNILHDLGYAVTLDMHPGPAFQMLHRAAPEEAYSRLEGLWQTIAKRYAKSDPDRLFFELLNEPALDDEDLWRSQAQRLIATLRQIDPERTLIFGTTGFQRPEVLIARPPFDDPNIVYAVHFYDPMVFTHQGADWMSPEPFADLTKVPFPAATGDSRLAALNAELERRGKSRAGAALKEAFSKPWTAARVDAVFAEVEAWSRRNRRPVMLNEFGVLAATARPADRITWIESVRRSAERHCLGWTYWELDRGFGFVDRGRANHIDLDVALALLKP